MSGMQRLELFGKPVAEKIEADVKIRVERFSQKVGRKPLLAIVLTGHDPASEIYVRHKVKACERAGINACIYRPQDLVSLEDTLQKLEGNTYRSAAWLEKLDQPSEILPDGIIMQLPLPAGMREHTTRLFKEIDPRRDVDGFNPISMGLLVQGRSMFFPCTPYAITSILRHYGIPIAGQHVVIINRSDIVGKPLSTMLIHDNDDYANATVTICHIKTPTWRLKQIAITADILVVAVGIPGFVTADMVHDGMTLIDVGINRLADGSVVGDAALEAVQAARCYTPVPGGVGPVTVAAVLLNTITAAENLEGLS